jgi:hypothetical protein
MQVPFNAFTLHLQPLFIMGLEYYWSLDFVNSLSLIVWHNQYVLVIIEHLLKWLKLVPLPDRNNEGATYAFLEKVLGRFGVTTKVSLSKVWNSNIYVGKLIFIITQLQKNILN